MYQNLIKPFAKDAFKFVLDTLFPVYCLVCEKENEFICENCKVQFKKLEYQYCIACQRPSIGGLTHPKCKTPYLPEGLISIFNYHDKKLSNVLIKGKYKFLPKVYEILGEMMVKNLSTDFPNLLNLKSANLNLLLVPLPLHKQRLRWRGFNQAEILAKSIAEIIDQINNTTEIAVKILLTRSKSTKTQKDLKKEERIKNVKDAFQLQKGINAHKKNIILIDDVTTTGSTLLEAAKILKRNGAKEIWCLTVARD